MQRKISRWSACSILAFAVVACGPPQTHGFDVVGSDGAIDDIARDSVSNDTNPSDAHDVTGQDAPPSDSGSDAGPLPPAVDIIAPGTPADAPTRFGGTANPARAPDIVYPTDGTIVPHNLSGFEVHFHAGTGNDLFEVSFRGVSTVVRVYTGCTAAGGGCVLTLDDTTFETIGRAAGGDGQVTLMVRGTAMAGGGVGSSATRTLGVSGVDIRGGIYYWSAGAGSIMRYEFGLPGAHPELYMAGNPFACVGCHILSRDGQRIAVGHFIPGPSAMQTYDVSTVATVGAGYGANFGSFSPDNAHLIISDGAHLTLLDSAAGTDTHVLAAGTAGSMPDWSADGNHVVYALPSTIIPFGGSPGHSGAADLNVMDWDGAAFGTPRSLVHSSGENNYYPSYSPDNGWVLFNRTTGDSYNNIAAHLFATNATGGTTPVHLANADDSTDVGNSWPKWAPFVQTYQGEPIMWFTFASRRDYGLRLQQQSRAMDMRTSQLWMAGFRPGHSSTDPSVPAFWLPFQNIGEGNHIAQWTQVVRRRSCVLDTDCGANEMCQSIAAAGVCVGR